MAHIIHTPRTSPGVTSATTLLQSKAKHTLSEYRKELEHEVARDAILNSMAQDAVVIYKLTRLPSKIVYAGNNTVTVQPIIKDQ